MEVLSNSPLDINKSWSLNDPNFESQIFFTDTADKLYFAIMDYVDDYNIIVLYNGVLQGHSNGYDYDYRFDFNNFINILYNQSLGNGEILNIDPKVKIEYIKTFTKLYLSYSSTTLILDAIGASNLVTNAKGQTVVDLSLATFNSLANKTDIWFKFYDRKETLIETIFNTPLKGKYFPITASNNKYYLILKDIGGNTINTHRLDLEAETDLFSGINYWVYVPLNCHTVEVYDYNNITNSNINWNEVKYGASPRVNTNANLVVGTDYTATHGGKCVALVENDPLNPDNGYEEGYNTYLILANSQSPSLKWYDNGGATLNVAEKLSDNNGYTNFGLMFKYSGNGTWWDYYLTLEIENQTGWYLPSVNELKQIGYNGYLDAETTGEIWSSSGRGNSAYFIQKNSVGKYVSTLAPNNLAKEMVAIRRVKVLQGENDPDLTKVFLNSEFGGYSVKEFFVGDEINQPYLFSNINYEFKNKRNTIYNYIDPISEYLYTTLTRLTMRSLPNVIDWNIGFKARGEGEIQLKASDSYSSIYTLTQDWSDIVFTFSMGSSDSFQLIPYNGSIIDFCFKDFYIYPVDYITYFPNTVASWIPSIYAMGKYNVWKTVLKAEEICDNKKPLYYYDTNGRILDLISDGNQKSIENTTKKEIIANNTPIILKEETKKQLVINTGYRMDENRMYSLMRTPFVYYNNPNYKTLNVDLLGDASIFSTDTQYKWLLDNATFVSNKVVINHYTGNAYNKYIRMNPVWMQTQPRQNYSYLYYYKVVDYVSGEHRLALGNIGSEWSTGDGFFTGRIYQDSNINTVEDLVLSIQGKNNVTNNYKIESIYVVIVEPIDNSLLELKKMKITNSSFDGWKGKNLSERNIELILEDPKTYRRKTTRELGFYD